MGETVADRAGDIGTVADPNRLPWGLRPQLRGLGRAASWRHQVALVWAISSREIRDTMRDWRLVVPILLLTLVFPVILNFGASLTLNYVRRFNAAAMGEQAIPFLLLVVGFFPISFSLVLALETFVGEKERKSLEPLLATPLSNTQLYLGKTLAALIPPVLAAYLGTVVYFGSLFLFIDYRPSWLLMLQIVLLTTAEAMVMVSGAVIVSSQTTSVRAANLLASFIILPMAFLVQAEALILFWRRNVLLWYILLALAVCNLILVRMGIRIFNREELLGREIDRLNLRQSWRLFKGYLLDPPDLDRPTSAVRRSSGPTPIASRLARFYRHDVPQLVRMNLAALVVVMLGLLAAGLIGWVYAALYPLPGELFALENIQIETFDQFEGTSFLPDLSTWGIFGNNVRALLAGGVLGVFSFGSLAVVLLMAPIAVIGFATVQVGMAGYNPLLFIGTFVLPHGILELPAAMLATAAAVRLGLAIVHPPRGLTVGQSWLQAFAHFIKLFVLVILPLLALAAFIEVNVTPQLVVAVYGN